MVRGGPEAPRCELHGALDSVRPGAAERGHSGAVSTPSWPMSFGRVILERCANHLDPGDLYSAK